MRLRHFLALLPALALCACGDNRLPQVELSGHAMGTTFKVLLVEPSETLSPDELEGELVAALQAVDRLASTWRDDSELTALNDDLSIDWIPVSAEFCDLLDNSLEMSRISDGAFDLTIGPLVNLWGFGPGSNHRRPPTSPPRSTVLVTTCWKPIAPNAWCAKTFPTCTLTFLAGPKGTRSTGWLRSWTLAA